jgi:hypothetical protein
MKRMIAIGAILGLGLGGVFAVFDVYGWPRIEPGLVEFLNGKTVMDWATVALGL